MFRPLDSHTPVLIEIEVDGEPVAVPDGISVAAALLYLGRIPTRFNLTASSPRAAYCMMGLCFDCLVEIDDLANQRACQFDVRPGMRVGRQMSQPNEQAEE